VYDRTHAHRGSELAVEQTRAERARAHPSPRDAEHRGPGAHVGPGIALGLAVGSRIVRSAAVIQRVQVKTKGGQMKEISALDPPEMLAYLNSYLFEGTIPVDAVKDIQTWLKSHDSKDDTILKIKRAFWKVNKEMPEAVKTFPAGTTILTRAEIEAAAKSPGMIGKSAYSLSATGSGLTLSMRENVLGWIRYNVVEDTLIEGKSQAERKIKVGKVQTINVSPRYQGLNLSRILMAAFCAKAMSDNAEEYRLGTEDTSGGWWGQWGTRNLKKILQRGDMQQIHLPTHVEVEAAANEKKELEKIKAEEAKKKLASEVKTQ
jgi:hypothetical protein